MQDLHELFTINGLTPEQARALASAVLTAQNSDGEKRPALGTFLTLMSIIVTIVTAGTFGGLLWLFSSYASISDRVSDMENSQKRIFETLDEIRGRLTPKTP